MIQHDDSQQAFAAPVLPPATRLGHVHLTVADLERQLAFYQDVLGLTLHWREGTTAGLGTGKEDLLRQHPRLDALLPRRAGISGIEPVAWVAHG